MTGRQIERQALTLILLFRKKKFTLIFDTTATAGVGIKNKLFFRDVILQARDEELHLHLDQGVRVHRNSD